MQELRIQEADAGQRLDRYLRKLLDAMPLGAIFRHLRNGGIKVDGKKAKPDLRIAAGMVLTLRLPAADLERIEQRRTPQRPRPPVEAPRRPAPKIVYRDLDVMIVDKPAGMAVQPGSGQGEDHLCAWIDIEAARARTATFQPAPAHRLDRGTSGLCAIGLSPSGSRGLAAAFRGGTAHKVYLAVVHGVPESASGTIDRPLRQIAGASSDGPKVECAASGKPARTDFEVVTSAGDRALLRLVLHTGRMHQIRAHLAFLGHPIVGDRRYGSPSRMGHGFLLHAAELTLPHPTKGTELRAVAPPPAGFEL